jgi:hypothetical protein
MQKGYLGVKDIFDAEKNRQIVASGLELVYDLQHTDFWPTITSEGSDDDFTFGGDVKIT